LLLRASRSRPNGKGYIFDGAVDLSPADFGNKRQITYHEGMARGWESKSIEEQQLVDHATETDANRAQSKQARADHAQRERQKQELELQRERVLSERTSNPVRRAALTAALADIESKLAVLG
jgi:hypothetical protein